MQSAESEAGVELEIPITTSEAKAGIKDPFSKSKIKNTTAHYGGYRDKIRYKWSGKLHDYSLMAKTIRDYGEDPETKVPFTIDYSITSLLDI